MKNPDPRHQWIWIVCEAERTAFHQLYIYKHMFTYIPQAHLLEKKKKKEQRLRKEAPNIVAHTE